MCTFPSTCRVLSPTATVLRPEFLIAFFYSVETNQLVGILEWQEDVIKETGGEFLLLHVSFIPQLCVHEFLKYFVKYADLYTMLYDLAVCAGASITFNTEIVSVYVDEEKEMPMAMLADGTLLTADLIIGADGSRSVARE